MKNVLILHGVGNNSKGNWFPWIKKELEAKGYKVWTPNLPNSDKPIVKDWLDAIFSNKEWIFNNESIIVGHSAGAAFVLRILEKLSVKQKISKAILVAGFTDLGSNKEYFECKKDLVKKEFHWKKIKDSCDKFYFIHSDNDRYECDVNQGKIMQKNLGGELIIKPGEDHFNLETNPKYKKFPFLLKLID